MDGAGWFRPALRDGVVLSGFRTQDFILGYSRFSLRERLAKAGDSVVALMLREA